FPLGPLADDGLPWFIGQFRCGKPVYMSCLPGDLPPEAEKERHYCEAHGIKSNVAIPLKAGGVILGALTFAFLKRRCEWPAEILSRLQMIGEVFANALLRRRSDEALHAALAENEALRARLERENLYLREQVVLKHRPERIVGQSEALKKVLSQAERVAVTDTPVLLVGETGSGKELLAQAIHELSARKDRPMVIVNCASLPATLVESELFGREAGAYTGAASAQVGRFVVADGSTLFLDEIGEFPVEVQAKLLRVLQDGRFERLGSPETVTVNVRIIAATNRDLEQAVREGKFRADLYHRLNVFPIRVPPLRERPDDIPPLLWAFVQAFGRRMGKTITGIPQETIQQLQRYSWPGNVRELSNVVERAMILTTGDILHIELPSASQQAGIPRSTLKESERAHILCVLGETGWRIRGARGAAEILGIKPTTLESRMAKLGIKRQD
ncbi:MAG: sigma 54-interacting transcriptional regulator, partial [Thermoguttaceae bacterium]|nr:sigma 54-interacting transcriptional regulator [Thermoguttaceae bacterium]